MKKYLLALAVLIGPLVAYAADVVTTTTSGSIPVDVPSLVSTLSKTILDVLLPVIVSLIAWLLKKGLDMIKLSFLRNLVKRWVFSAFQQFENKPERYDYVAKKLHEKFKFLTEAEIKDYIEEAVAELKAEFAGTKYENK